MLNLTIGLSVIAILLAIYILYSLLTKEESESDYTQKLKQINKRYTEELKAISNKHVQILKSELNEHKLLLESERNEHNAHLKNEEEEFKTQLTKLTQQQKELTSVIIKFRDNFILLNNAIGEIEDKNKHIKKLEGMIKQRDKKIERIKNGRI